MPFYFWQLFIYYILLCHALRYHILLYLTHLHNRNIDDFWTLNLRHPLSSYIVIKKNNGTVNLDAANGHMLFIRFYLSSVFIRRLNLTVTPPHRFRPTRFRRSPSVLQSKVQKSSRAHVCRMIKIIKISFPICNKYCNTVSDGWLSSATFVIQQLIPARKLQTLRKNKVLLARMRIRHVVNYLIV